MIGALKGGPRGPTGLAGATGPTGPTGPEGPAHIRTRLELVAASFSLTPASGPTTILSTTATGSAGDRVLSVIWGSLRLEAATGASVTLVIDGAAQPTASYQNSNAGPIIWAMDHQHIHTYATTGVHTFEVRITVTIGTAILTTANPAGLTLCDAGITLPL